MKKITMLIFLALITMIYVHAETITQKIPGIGEYAEDEAVDPSALKKMNITTYTSEPCSMSGNETPFDS